MAEGVTVPAVDPARATKITGVEPLVGGDRPELTEEDLDNLAGLRDQAVRELLTLRDNPRRGKSKSGQLRGTRALVFNMPGGAYRAALRAADQRVGRLLGTVRGRPSYPRERWTAVVVTDHGHLDEGGHGGREPEVTAAWAAAAGPGIAPGGPPLITRQDQVAPLVLGAVGLAGARTA